MAEVGYLRDVIVILLAAIVTVLLFQRLGFGAVLGYLVAGLVIGPGLLGLVSDLETVRAIAELGVVFLLFTVGLELPFERIRLIGWRFFSLGLLQVALSALALALLAVALGFSPPAAAAIGAALALSSTAIVLRMLSDRGELTSRFGRSAFAVLLVQDLALGPILVVTLALGGDGASLWEDLGLAALKMTLAVMCILGLGRIMLRYAVWPIPRFQEPEIFAALTLLIVLVSGLATHLAGLSMGFGAFLAGMLLAETRYRLQVAAEIQPFRALLLGLFFMTVGMSIDPALAFEHAGTLTLLILVLLIGKSVILAGLARLLGQPPAESLRLGLLLSQGGEFAFVLLGAAVVAGLITTEQSQPLVLAVALTMLLTPLLARLALVLAGRVERASAVGPEESEAETEALSDHVVVAGYGRVGTAVIGRLQADGVAWVAVDLDPHRIAQARQRGLPVFFGDATKPEILAALHVERARAVVVAVDDPAAALRLTGFIHYLFPELRILARAKNEAHATALRKAGAADVVPELVATGVKLATTILEPDAPCAPDPPEAPDTPKTPDAPEPPDAPR